MRFPFLVRVGLSLLFVQSLFAYAEKSSSQIRSLAVSPNGKTIAVDFGKDNTSFIYEVSLQTGIVTRLTDVKTGVESGPAFSPDGKRIAYSYSLA